MLPAVAGAASRARHAAAVAASLATGTFACALEPDPPIDCANCVEWNEPLAPFQIHGNTYYVGTAELAALVVTTADGLVLLDGALPQSAALIDASISQLGFETADIRLIVNSHAHFDHAGGIAALQRTSGAVVAVSPASAVAFRGEPAVDDPQFTVGSTRFPVVGNLRVVNDGETLRIGGVDFTAHFTPGHTPGGTTWTWRSCEAESCLDVVYADSLNAVSADDFKFTGDAERPSVIEAFRASIETVANLPCDILIAPHPGFIDLRGKVARRSASTPNPFVDSDACRRYAGAAGTRLEQRIAAEMNAAQ